MNISIIPQSANISITSCKVVSMNVMLFSHALISVDLYSNSNFIKNTMLTMTNEEYEAWSSDDYLIEYVLGKLGFEKSPEVVSVASAE